MAFTTWSSKLPVALETHIDDMESFQEVKVQLEKVTKDVDELLREISNRSLDKSGDKISGDVTLGSVYIETDLVIGTSTVSANDSPLHVSNRFRINTSKNAIFIGEDAGSAFLEASNPLDNVGIGYQALKDITTGDSNAALGSYALTANLGGSYNMAIGDRSLAANTTGNYNVGVGTNTMRVDLTGLGNVAIGYAALDGGAATGTQYNVAVGYQAIKNITTADNNVGIGKQALLAATTGSHNTALGPLAMDAVTTGYSNVAIGYNAGGALTTGFSNVFIGNGAGDAGQTVDITNSIAIGLGVVTTVSNQTVIGNNSTTAGIIYGLIDFPDGITAGTLGAHAHTSAGAGGDYAWADFVAADVTYLQALVADITQTNLVDKSAAETITGAWTWQYTDATTFSGTELLPSQLKINNTSTTNNTGTQIVLQSRSTGTTRSLITSWTPSANNSNLSFSNEIANAQTEVMRLRGGYTHILSGLYIGAVGTDPAADGGLTPKLVVANPSDATQWVAVGYDNTNDAGFVYAVDTQSAWKNLMLQPISGNVGIGTLTAPHGGVGMAKLAIEGTNASTAGPHMQFTTATDDYPVYCIYPWQHDEIYLAFDGYLQAGWKSSDAGSNFLFAKNADRFSLNAKFGIAAEAAITWDERFGISSAETVFNEAGIDINHRIETLNEPNFFFIDGALEWLRIGDWDTNYAQISKTGDLTFVGASGLLFGDMYVNSNVNTTSVSSAGYTQFNHFDTNGVSNGATPDRTNNHITIATAGMYLVTASVTVENSSGAAHKIEAKVEKNNGGAALVNVHAERTLGTGADKGSMSLNGIVDLAANDTIELWFTSDSGAARNITISDCCLSLAMIGGT